MADETTMQPPGHDRSSLTALTKHHGLGNDFLVALDPPSDPGSGEARRWCHRRTGIGADGLILARPVEGRSDQWAMVLWNADGGRAEISGNGIRCLAQAIGLHLGQTSPATLTINTDAGPRLVHVGAMNGDTWQVRAGMGAAKAGPEPSPAWAEAGMAPLHQRGVDVGNPHIVALLDDAQAFEQVDMEAVGPIIEAGYPAGINVHVVHVKSPEQLGLKVWERGVGVTQACGSGACAAAWAAHTVGLGGRIITVTMPGGSATVELSGSEVFLTGPATYVGSIVLA
jgi:diaminopimelate epimerase